MISDRLTRYVPLLVWVLVGLAILLIPWKILSLGYLPGDDGLRYAAKAVSGKAWTDVLVVRPGITLDHNPGWNAFLAGIHRWTGTGTDGLVAFSVTVLFCLFGFSMLPGLRRPEAWLATLLIMAVLAPAFLLRLAFGRPYIVSMAVLVVLLWRWRRYELECPSLAVLGASTALIALAVWVHGAWYLFALPILAFALAGRWWVGGWLAICTGLATILGALPTGHPIQFITQAVNILTHALGESLPPRMQVAEFCPFDGDFRMVGLVGFVLLVKAVRGRWNYDWLRQPSFMLAVLGWVLGFRAHRSWLDWGLPALLVWVCLELQEWLESALPLDALQRLGLTVFLALGLYSATTCDYGGRWTDNLTTEYLTTDNPDLSDWLPRRNGLIYNSDMRIFYQTFFKNPLAPWRYVLGFEPTLMTEENLKALRRIQWNYGDARAYEPWVKEMRTEDRLIIRAPAGHQPAIPSLEWHYAVTDTWIGRLPRGAGGR